MFVFTIIKLNIEISYQCRKSKLLESEKYTKKNLSLALLFKVSNIKEEINNKHKKLKVYWIHNDLSAT